MLSGICDKVKLERNGLRKEQFGFEVEFRESINETWLYGF